MMKFWLCTSFLLFTVNPSSDTFQRLSVIVKAPAQYKAYWTELHFTNADSSFIKEVQYTGDRILIDSLPLAKYRIRLCSVHNYFTEKEVDLGKVSQIVFDVRKLYAPDKSRVSFIDKLQSGDTLFIEYYERKAGVICVWGGAYHWTGYAALVKNDSDYIYLNRTKSGTVISRILDSAEMESMRKMEVQGLSQKNSNNEFLNSVEYVYVWNGLVREFSAHGPNIFRRINEMSE